MDKTESFSEGDEGKAADTQIDTLCQNLLPRGAWTIFAYLGKTGINFLPRQFRQKPNFYPGNLGKKNFLT